MNEAGRTGPAERPAFLEGLWTDRIVYFPIRHHSPVCARFLERLLRLWTPAAVLVEGPASFSRLIPLLLDPATRLPVAIHVSCPRPTPPDPEEGGGCPLLPGIAQDAAYYPFCESSPEWVALRVGSELGATVRFIDLDYGAQKRADRVRPESAPRVDSLLGERHLRRSRFLAELARRTHCRDHNDLWDHLFETRIGAAADADLDAVRSFLMDVAGWCHFARLDASDLAETGTEAREEAMAAAVQETLASVQGRIVVVTGGFHSVALPGRVASGRCVRPVPRAEEGESAVLVRYGFEALDALNGYAAGMVSPMFHDWIWRESQRRPGAEAAREVAARMLVEIGRATRAGGWASALSTADEIAALEQACRMAGLRGHPGPTREDLLDGIRSCLVKGALDADGAAILKLAAQVMGGTALGEVPPGAGAPPIVLDARETARRLRLATGDSASRDLELDLYRKGVHRRTSRFLHGLAFLGVDFGRFVAGPDFVAGTGLDRLVEHWRCAWTPMVEGALVEASLYGASVEEAVANRWVREVAELEAKGRGRCAREAVSLLIHACRMGLHRHTARLMALIASHVSADADLGSLVVGLRQLMLLWESREPLEAHGIAEVPTLIQAAYLRAGVLLLAVGDTPAEAADAMLDALVELRDLAGGEGGRRLGLDPELFLDALPRLLSQPGCSPVLVGGAAGILNGAGRLADAELVRFLGGSLNAVGTQPGAQTGFLTGLLRTARELAWRMPEVTEAMDAWMSAWTEDEFLERLPHLRLAFAELTPRETDRVAEMVGRRHGDRGPIGAVRAGISLEEAMVLARLDSHLGRALDDDGLGGWVQSPDHPVHTS